MKLRDLPGEWMRLYEYAEVVADEEHDLFNDTLNELLADSDEALDNALTVRSMLLGDVDMLDREIKRLTAKKKAVEGNVSHIEYGVRAVVDLLPNRKKDTGLYKIGFRKSPPHVVIDDGADIPIKYLIAQDPKIDKEGLKAAIKAGESFEGIRLESGESLSIR